MEADNIIYKCTYAGCAFETTRKSSYTKHNYKHSDVIKGLKIVAKKEVRKQNKEDKNVVIENTEVETANKIINTQVDTVLEAVADLKEVICRQDEYISKIIKKFCIVEEELKENKICLKNLDICNANVLNKTDKILELIRSKYFSLDLVN